MGTSSVVILFVATLVSLPNFNNASFLFYACSKAAAGDENINRNFCLKSLQSDPKSASANLTGLAYISTKLAIRSTTRTISHINYLLSKPAYAHLKKDLSFCKDRYTESVQALFDAVKQIRSSSSNDVNWAITGAMTGMEDCQDESSDQSILVNDRAKAFQLCAMALTFLDKNTFR